MITSQQLLRAKALVQAAFRITRASQGELRCPVCDAEGRPGYLMWTHNPRNGRTHARCTSAHCVHYQEGDGE